MQRDGAVDGERLHSLLASLDQASDIEQSHPSRQAALHAIAPLTPFLHPADRESSPLSPPILAASHRLILRLLQDDNEDIRVTAAEIVRKGLGRRRAVCHSKAMALEWHFIAEAAGRDGLSTWGALLSNALLDKESYGKS